jgi:hypothetical protein
MALRSSVIGMSLVALTVCGCGKKRQEPVVETAIPAFTEQKETTDVFNEFYSDSKEPEKKVSPTFSMNEPSSPSYSPAYKKGGAYVVQVATMVSRSLAEELATELKEKRYPAYVSEVQNPRKDLQGTYYRVRIGSFATIPEAKAFGENVLKPANFSFWVDRGANDQAPSANRQTSTTPPPSPAPNPTPTVNKQPSESGSPNQWNDDANTW